MAFLLAWKAAGVQAAQAEEVLLLLTHVQQQLQQLLAAMR
jgi:hypothetical protein